MASDEDSKNTESERSNNEPSDDAVERKNSSVGFVIDGVDIRDYEIDELDIASAELNFEPEPDDKFELFFPQKDSFEAARTPSTSEPPRTEQSFVPPSEFAPPSKFAPPARSGSPSKSATPTKAGSQSKSAQPPRSGSQSKSAQPSKSVPHNKQSKNRITDSIRNDENFQEFFKENVIRPSNFRLTSNNMLYYPQISFGSGVKYSGTVTLSQTAMLVLAASKMEALRQGRQKIGCEHLLLALLQNHGFPAGQLVLSLHLNAIGKPYALGDMMGTARRIIDGPDAVNFDRMSAIARGGKIDMCFTPEADQVLMESLYLAATEGVASVATKHILSALIDCDNEEVQAALGALYVTRNEIRAALSVCPPVDDMREFALYMLCSILYMFIRIRIFQQPIKRYREFAARKEVVRKVK